MSHIDGMLSLYDWLVDDATRAVMTPADWLQLVLGTYFHDFGLLVTQDEYDMRESTSFPDYRRRAFDGGDPDLRDYGAQVGSLDDAALDRFLYGEFVRHHHAARIRSWLTDEADSGIGVDPRLRGYLKSLIAPLGVTFVEDLALICQSHHLDDLGETSRYKVSRPYGRTRSEEANVQFVALLLRTADLLHVTKDRVPSVAAVVVNPRDPISQLEWAKQSAVRSVRPRPNDDDRSHRTIEVHATFVQADGFFALTTYLAYAQAELARSYEWSHASQARHDHSYVFPWRYIDTSSIEARGFVSEPFNFTIDQHSILELLTGHTLYNDADVVVRELVQNSLDAARLAAST
ncbi:MAG: hypothetical protein JO079_00425, partial [Frankiaceae bacterium]|nr:hypothetical protein [Frankiaceae bacterium]MBV9369405.1 hypothetical protein [Frankiales bacterium]